MRKGLVLEGGGMRGMYTAGVLDVMMERSVEVDGIVGVSAGAVFGCNYKSGQIGRVIRYNTTYCRDPRYVSLRSLIKTGDLYGEQFCYHDIPEELDPFDAEAFERNPVEFYVTCTDVLTGKPIYRRCTKGDGADLQWMRASASMPLVSRIVTAVGYKLLDGGISDSIPIEWMREKGYRKNIVVLTRPEGYRKRKSGGRALFRTAYRKYPAVAETIEKRHIMYNETLDKIWELRKTGEIFVLSPSREIKLSRIERNPDKLQEMYQLGREDAQSQLKNMVDFLSD